LLRLQSEDRAVEQHEAIHAAVRQRLGDVVDVGLADVRCGLGEQGEVVIVFPSPESDTDLSLKGKTMATRRIVVLVPLFALGLLAPLRASSSISYFRLSMCVSMTVPYFRILPSQPAAVR